MVVWDVVKKAFADNILESMFDTYQQLIEQADDLGFWRTELRDLRSPHDIEVQDRVNRTYDNTIEKTCLSDGFDAALDCEKPRIDGSYSQGTNIYLSRTQTACRPIQYAPGSK